MNILNKENLPEFCADLVCNTISIFPEIEDKNNGKELSYNQGMFDTLAYQVATFLTLYGGIDCCPFSDAMDLLDFEMNVLDFNLSSNKEYKERVIKKIREYIK